MSDPFGPTGNFPKGHLGPNDEGELTLGVADNDGKVIIRFGVPVKWIGLDPQDAANLASALIRHAREAARHTGVAITIDMAGGWKSVQ